MQLNWLELGWRSEKQKKKANVVSSRAFRPVPETLDLTTTEELYLPQIEVSSKAIRGELGLQAAGIGEGEVNGFTADYVIKGSDAEEGAGSVEPSHALCDLRGSG
jgi:hypothetical protein